MTVDVLLVRHAESTANREGRLAYARNDPGLTAKGQRQAQRLALALDGKPVDAVVTSPLRRAIETATPLAERRGLTPIVLSDLREIGLGAWDGKLLRDLAHDEPEALSAWRADPDANPAPGGERILAAGQRVLNALDTLCAAQTIRHLVGVSHGDCLKGVLMMTLGASGRAAGRITVGNGGAVRLQRSADGVWRLVAWPLAGDGSADG